MNDARFGHFVRFVILVLLSGLVETASAQQFNIDPIFSDSLACEPVVLSDSVYKPENDAKSIMVARGTVIDSCGCTNKRSEIVFLLGGHHYAVSKNELRWSTVNPPTMANTLSKNIQWRHSQFGRWYATLIPCWLILGLIVAAIAIGILTSAYARRYGVAWKAGMVAVPLCFLGVVAIEVAGAALHGGDALWWLDRERYGLWSVLLRLIPVVLVLIVQAASLYFYEKLLFSDEGGSVSVKPTLIGIVAFIPVAVVYFIVVNGLLGMHSSTATNIGLCLSGAVLFGGIGLSLWRNIIQTDWLIGSVLTLFVVVYVASAVFIVAAVVIIIISLLIPLLMTLGALLFLAALVGSKSYYRDQYGNRYERDGLGNMRRL